MMCCGQVEVLRAVAAFANRLTLHADRSRTIRLLLFALFTGCGLALSHVDRLWPNRQQESGRSGHNI
jgi:hypothetical protein